MEFSPHGSKTEKAPGALELSPKGESQIKWLLRILETVSLADEPPI